MNNKCISPADEDAEIALQGYDEIYFPLFFTMLLWDR